MVSSSAPAWIAFSASILALIANIGITAWQRNQAAKDKLMDQRRNALFSALDVIDHIYSNLEIDGKPPSNPHKWPIVDARKAMNGILIYCANPTIVMKLFREAIGLHNPTIDTSPKPPNMQALAELRKAISKELGLPELEHSDSDVIWIQTAAGGE